MGEGYGSKWADLKEASRESTFSIWLWSKKLLQSAPSLASVSRLGGMCAASVDSLACTPSGIVPAASDHSIEVWLSMNLFVYLEASESCEAMDL